MTSSHEEEELREAVPHMGGEGSLNPQLAAQLVGEPFPALSVRGALHELVDEKQSIRLHTKVVARGDDRC